MARSFSILGRTAVAVAISVSCLRLFSADTAASKSVATNDRSKAASVVLGRWIDAIGGESTIRKLTNRVSEGTLEVSSQGISLQIKVESQAPNQRRTTIVLPGGAAEIVSGFDGKKAWRSMPGQGVVELTGEEAALAQEEAHYWELLEASKVYKQLELKGEEVVAGEPCHRLEATTTAGKPHTFYFSKKSGLMLRRDGEAPMPDGTMAPTETYYEGYADKDGMKIALKVRRAKPESFAFVYATSVVKHNQPMPAARFQKPETK